MKTLVEATTNLPPVNDMDSYVKELNNVGISYLHCDVADGKFVPTIALSVGQVRRLSRLSTHPLDVHLMIKGISKAVKYARYAEIVSIHVEAIKDIEKGKRLLTRINKYCRSGLAISPDTDVDRLLPFLPYVGHVLVMGVHPGYSGQKFIPETIDRVKRVVCAIKDLELTDVTVGVDGGVGLDNAAELVRAGASVLSVGSAIYKADDRDKFVRDMQGKNCK